MHVALCQVTEQRAVLGYSCRVLSVLSLSLHFSFPFLLALFLPPSLPPFPSLFLSSQPPTQALWKKRKILLISSIFLLDKKNYLMMSNKHISQLVRKVLITPTAKVTRARERLGAIKESP